MIVRFTDPPYAIWPKWKKKKSQFLIFIFFGPPAQYFLVLIRERHPVTPQTIFETSLFQQNSTQYNGCCVGTVAMCRYVVKTTIRDLLTLVRPEDTLC